MKNKNKIFIILILMFFLTGCTVDYNLSISQNKIYETIIVQTDNINIDYKVLSTIKSDYGSNYEIDYDADPEECTDDNENCSVEEISMTSFGAYKTYNDFNKYIKSQAASDFYGDINISENNNIYTLIGTPKGQLESILNDVNYISSLAKELKINITIPYKVTEHNATSIDGNTYTWIYNKSNLSNQIKLVYTTDETTTENTNDNTDNNTNTKKEANKKPNYVFWIVVIGIIAITAVTIVNKLKKNDSV